MTDGNTTFDAYKSVVTNLRKERLGILGLNGRPKKGPRFYAITKCTEEEGEQLGITSSSATKGERWACKTCFAFAEPIWADGPLPDIEELRDEWADWIVKHEGTVGKRRTRIGMRNFV